VSKSAMHTCSSFILTAFCRAKNLFSIR